MISLRDLQEQNWTWAQHNFPDAPMHGDGPLLGAMEELGELAHAQLKGRQGIRHSSVAIYSMKVDAVADVIIYLADYCNREGIDLQTALDHTWPNVQKRDWIAYPENGLTE